MHTHNKSHKLFPVLGNQLGSSRSGGREVRLLLHTPDGALDSFGWLVSFVSLGSLVSTELVLSGLGRRMRCCLFLLNVPSSELTVKDCVLPPPGPLLHSFFQGPKHDLLTVTTLLPHDENRIFSSVFVCSSDLLSARRWGLELEVSRWLEHLELRGTVTDL